MTKIYLVRHCEAMGNLNRIFQGVSDFDITETGAIQLGFLEKKFENIKIDKIYSSPLMRTYKTAMAVNGKKKLEIIKDKRLIEIDGGILEGKPYFDSFAKNPDLEDAWYNHPQDFHPQNGEPMSDAYERIYNAILKIAEENRDKSIACATHGGVIRCLLCRLMYNNINELKNTPWSENTAITLLSIDDKNNFKVEFYNNTEHLPKKYLPKRSKLTVITKG